jgi:hypothetical protein
MVEKTSRDMPLALAVDFEGTDWTDVLEETEVAGDDTTAEGDNGEDEAADVGVVGVSGSYDMADTESMSHLSLDS